MLNEGLMNLDEQRKMLIEIHTIYIYTAIDIYVFYNYFALKSVSYAFDMHAICKQCKLYLFLLLLSILFM